MCLNAACVTKISVDNQACVRYQNSCCFRLIDASKSRAVDDTGALTRTTFPDSSAMLSLAHAVRRHIVDVLQKSNWWIAGRGGTAEILGLKRTTLQSKIKKLGIQRPAV